MGTYTDSQADLHRPARYVPAYGPVDAVLGYALFYVVVDRVTPTVVDVGTTVLPGVAPSAIGFALAAALSFILVVTVVDQLRRQLAAAGLSSHSEIDPDPSTRTPPSEPLALGYLLVGVFGGGIAWLTFEPAMRALNSLIPVVATLDVGGFVVAQFVVLVVFFLSFAAATRSLDRLLVGGVRWLQAA
jgi:hypothetical protein